MTALRVLIAPDSFKGTLSSDQAADAIASGVRDVLPEAEAVLLPLADGGEGSVDALIRAGFTAHDISTSGPVGDGASSRMALDGDTVVVELANTCGLLLLPEGQREPMRASTQALGEAIRAALDFSPDRIVVCVGGSASTDGGSGLITALGVQLLDAAGTPVAPCGETLAAIARIDTTGLNARLVGTRIEIATDVSNPLLGASGAAQVFAPQKGADPAQVAELEAGLAHWSALLAEATGIDAAAVQGSGAGGGVALPLICLAGATITSGAQFIADATHLADEIQRADVVITGEGSFDEQSLMGKGAGELVRSALAHDRATLVVAGNVGLQLPGLAAIALSDVSPERATSDAASVLREATGRLLRDQATSIERLARP